MVKANLISSTRAAIKDSPPEIFNWYLIFCTCVWSFSGVAKGFDEGMWMLCIHEDLFDELTCLGNIASAVVMESFMEKFGLDKLSEDEYVNTKGWIVSIATAGAVIGCLGCIHLTQRLGRRITMQIFTLVYIAGILGQTFSDGNLKGLYASRFIAGIGIGTTTALPSIYISEVS